MYIESNHRQSPEHRENQPNVPIIVGLDLIQTPTNYYVVELNGFSSGMGGAKDSNQTIQKIYDQINNPDLKFLDDRLLDKTPGRARWDYLRSVIGRHYLNLLLDEQAFEQNALAKYTAGLLYKSFLSLPIYSRYRYIRSELNRADQILSSKIDQQPFIHPDHRIPYQVIDASDNNPITTKFSGIPQVVKPSGGYQGIGVVILDEANSEVTLTSPHLQQDYVQSIYYGDNQSGIIRWLISIEKNRIIHFGGYVKLENRSIKGDPRVISYTHGSSAIPIPVADIPGIFTVAQSIGEHFSKELAKSIAT